MAPLLVSVLVLLAYWSCWPWPCWPCPYWSCCPPWPTALVLLALAVLVLLALLSALLALPVLVLLSPWPCRYWSCWPLLSALLPLAHAELLLYSVLTFLDLVWMLLPILFGLVLQVVEFAHCDPPSRWSSLTAVTASTRCRRCEALPGSGGLNPRSTGKSPIFARAVSRC